MLKSFGRLCKLPHDYLLSAAATLGGQSFRRRQQRGCRNVNKL